MLIFKHRTQLKQLKELKAIQEEKKSIQKQISKNKLFPICSIEAKKYINSFDYIDKFLAQNISSLWTGRIDINIFNDILQKHYNIDNASDYFEELGNYFLNLSGNIKHINPLKDRLKELDKKEHELKEKLGIK